MLNYEKIAEACKGLIIDEVYESNKIVQHIITKTGINKESILPKDYCYNVTNKGADGKRFVTWPRLFKYEGNKLYRYLGEGYPYNGPVVYSKDNAIYGIWKDGKFKEV